MLAQGILCLTYPLLFSGLTNAVNQGYLPSSIEEVPYSTGFLITLDENGKIPGYGDCTQGDEPITPFCSGGLISEGVFLTAAHCFENGKGDAVSDGSLDLSNLRVGLGALYPYRNNDGSCSGKLLGPEDGIYKVKAVFIHKEFKVIPNEYDYLNPKTGRKAEGAMGLDHMDIAVVYLKECTTPISGNKPRHGKIAGAIYPSLSQMWAPGAAGSPTNTGGMPASFWGYGESEDDRMYDPENPGEFLPKAVRRGDWNLNRATTSFTTTGSDNVEKIWSNCDWLEEDAPVWNSGTDSAKKGYAGGDDSFPKNVKAAPFLACTLRNPNDPNVKSLCEDQKSKNTCTASKSMLGKSFCKWKKKACEIDEDTVGGIGLVTYPSSGGGDSGAAAWHLQQDSDINDRDELELVHIGIVHAASVLYPAWDQVVRTDYFQNWLAQVIDRDICAAFETKEYFAGFDDYPFTRAPQAQWNNLSKYYVGKVKGEKGAQSLSLLQKRGNAGDWEPTSPTQAPITSEPTDSDLPKYCFDDTEWVDGHGKERDCSWYSTTKRCKKAKKWADPETGDTAKDACCNCGGGEMVKCLDGDEDLDPGEEWRDTKGGKCGWYEKKSKNRCKKANKWQNKENGLSAKDVCCICGGGELIWDDDE